VNAFGNRYQPAPIGATERQDGRCDTWQKALLCIDLQHLGCVEGFGVFENHRRSGVAEEAIEYYLERVREVVVPNVRRLQDYCRENDYEVIHFRIQSLTSDGRDRSPEHKRLGVHAAPGSKLAEFLPEVAPQDDEIVINKTASGIFVATNLEFVLRNLCVSELFVTGVYTNECISSAVRSASDLGFRVNLVSDGTAALTEELHEATLLTTHGRYARVLTSDEVIEYLDDPEAYEASR
jgi:nicotinamidase-related amidase